MPDGLAAALMATEGQVAAILEEMTADGLIEEATGMHRLTEEGKAVGAELMAADQQHWGVGRAVEALDAFLALDRRMKTIVTSWQMREVAGEHVLNDHTDEDYDAAVLADLGALHDDASAWLEPLTAALPRLENYRVRLDRASRMVGGGDHQYIAAPMLDSYHTIWFELHEDLILLAGRTRADETAAGRA
jgi:pyruvate,orthophosphate dikinase